MERIPPKEMAMKLVRQLRKQHPDYQYLKKVFGHIRKILEVTPEKREKRLPELLTDKELQAFYETVFSASNRTHMDVVGEFKMAYSERYNRLSVSLTPTYELRLTN